MTHKLYRIYNYETKQFSTGGSVPRFSKTGKVWATKSALSNHIRLVYETSKMLKLKSDPYATCQVIIYEVQEQVVGITAVPVYYHDLKERTDA